MPGDAENVVVRIQWIGGTSTEHSSIRNGMTPGEVARILGQPLSIEPIGGEVHWNYLGLPAEPILAASGDGPTKRVRNQ